MSDDETVNPDRGNGCCTWDITLPADRNTFPVIARHFKHVAKAWCFQKEKGSRTGYEHYQCRISLKTKARLQTVINDLQVGGIQLGKVSPTSKACRDNMFYVQKEDTRIEGPWQDDDIIPPEDMNPIMALRYPWQEFIVNHPIERRVINIVLDTKGDLGKSEIVKYCMVTKKGHMIPPTMMDATKLMGWVMDLPKLPLYLVDIPRAMRKHKLWELFVALETVKSGIAYDWRYKAKQTVFAVPNVWVFMNEVPDCSYLSADRWRFWGVRGDTIVPLPRGGDERPVPAPPAPDSVRPGTASPDP